MAEPVTLAAPKLLQATRQPFAKPLHIVAGIAICHDTAKAGSILLSRFLPRVLGHTFGQAVADPGHRGLVQKNICTSAWLLTGVIALI